MRSGRLCVRQRPVGLLQIGKIAETFGTTAQQIAFLQIVLRLCAVPDIQTIMELNFSEMRYYHRLPGFVPLYVHVQNVVRYIPFSMNFFAVRKERTVL